MKKTGYLSLFIILLFTACRKDINNVTITEFPEAPVVTTVDEWEGRIENIMGDLDGFIYDEEGTPLSSVLISINGLSMTTDQFGHFFFSQIQMNSKGAYVTAEKEGYFKGSRRFFPQDGAQSHVRIELLALGNGEIADNAEETTVSVSGGATLAFPVGAVKSTFGTDYEGIYFVHAKYLDPRVPETYNQMPGNLQGVSRFAEEQSLASLGMFAVELRDSLGQELTLAENKSVRLSFPIPEGLSSSAPDVVPLWSFKEEEGMWFEEGEAVLGDGFYIGEVSHFSFWNCDVPSDFIDLSMIFQSSNGTPVVNAQVIINSELSGIGTAWTDSDGYVAGPVPLGENLEIQILSLCGEVLYSENYEPFSEDTDLGIITIDVPGINEISISGSVIDCAAQPVDTAVLIIEIAGVVQYHYLSNSTFDISLVTCSDPSVINLTALDISTLIESETISVTPMPTIELGVLTACGETSDEGIITIRIDGGEEIPYTGGQVSSNSNETTTISLESNIFNISFSFNGFSPGDYSAPGASSVQYIQDLEIGYEFTGDEAEFESFIVTNYGETVVGSWSATLNNSSPIGGTAFVECTFSIPQ